MVVGAPMGFWKANMPQGMYLRSSCDWSLDPSGVHTIKAYLKKIDRTCRRSSPCREILTPLCRLVPARKGHPQPGCNREVAAHGRKRLVGGHG